MEQVWNDKMHVKMEADAVKRDVKGDGKLK